MLGPFIFLYTSMISVITYKTYLLDNTLMHHFSTSASQDLKVLYFQSVPNMNQTKCMYNTNAPNMCIFHWKKIYLASFNLHVSLCNPDNKLSFKIDIDKEIPPLEHWSAALHRMGQLSEYWFCPSSCFTFPDRLLLSHTPLHPVPVCTQATRWRGLTHKPSSDRFLSTWALTWTKGRSGLRS